MLVRHERERRKVQISGKSSCMVALPKKWVKELGLRQGSEVAITKLNASSLLINAQPDSLQGGGREASFTVGAEDQPDAVFRKVVSLYVLGFSRIAMESSKGFLSTSRKTALKDLIRRHLIGTEGVVESRDRMTVHVLLGYSELSVEAALKKMLLIVDSLRRDVSQAFHGDSEGSTEATSERQDEVGRFGLYVIRQLNLSLNQGVMQDLRLENRDTLGYIQITRTLERVAYHAGTLARVLTMMERPPSKLSMGSLESMSESAFELVDQAMLSLFKRDNEGADKAVIACKAYVERAAQVIRALDPTDSQAYYALHSAMDSQRRMAEYAREIAEIVLDMTVERTLLEREPEAIASY